MVTVYRLCAKLCDDFFDKKTRVTFSKDTNGFLWFDDRECGKMMVKHPGGASLIIRIPLEKLYDFRIEPWEIEESHRDSMRLMEAQEAWHSCFKDTKEEVVLYRGNILNKILQTQLAL